MLQFVGMELVDIKMIPKSTCSKFKCVSLVFIGMLPAKNLFCHLAKLSTVIILLTQLRYREISWVKSTVGDVNASMRSHVARDIRNVLVDFFDILEYKINQLIDVQKL